MHPVLLSVGEILWDQYPGSRLLGGAPFNLAAHAARLGFHSYFLSAVGADEPGDEALVRAAALGVDMTYTRRHPSWPTGIVDVTLDNGHPSYHLRRPAAWEEPEISACQAAALLALRPSWLVCGTLQQTCPKARATRLALSGIPLFYDVNLRPGFEDPNTVDELLQAATVVKCNDAELVWLQRELSLDGDPAEALLRRYPLTALCITLGPDGCRIHAHGETVYERPPAVAAIDTVGAGDAFIGAMRAELARGSSLESACRVAAVAGALATTVRGAVPSLPTRAAVDRFLS